MWIVEEIESPDEREQICAEIIATLPHWFGIAEANASYIEGVRSKDAFVVRDTTGTPIAMLCLNHPYPANVDIYWVGVRPDYHRKGLGKALFEAALARARELGCKTMTVETLSDKDPDAGYAKTRAFYLSMGFHPLFGLNPYGDHSPMVYMAKIL